jgi:hypothetical protein
MALPLFCQRLGDDLGLQTLFGIHLLQAPILAANAGIVLGIGKE